MMVDVNNGGELDAKMILKYFRHLVNRFFKILPIREENEPTLCEYMASLQSELIGCSALIAALNNDPIFLSLISTLQYFIDNPDEPVEKYKREVFRCISSCNCLKSKYYELYVKAVKQ